MNFDFPWKCYASDCSAAAVIACCSFIRKKTNYISLCSAATQPSTGKQQPLPPALEQQFPITKVQWGSGPHADWLASSGYDVHLWKLQEAAVRHVTLSNKKNLIAPPICSFDWSRCDATLLVSCSVDTTCTLWDVSAEAVKAHVIAHDKQVFDVAFSPETAEVYASAGADGSLRLYDGRSPDASKIAFESVGNQPITRIGWCHAAPHLCYALAQDSREVTIVDLRHSRRPFAVLRAHATDVTAAAWSPRSEHGISLASGDEDGNLLVWNLTAADGCQEPQLAHANSGSDSSSISYLAWPAALPNNLLVSVENTLSAVAVYE